MRVSVYTRQDGGTLKPLSARRIDLMKAAALHFGSRFDDDAPDGPPADGVWRKFGGNLQAVRLFGDTVQAQFPGNSFYEYEGVPPDVIADLWTAPEPGKWFRKHIIDGGYKHRRIANPAMVKDISDLDDGPTGAHNKIDEDPEDEEQP